MPTPTPCRARGFFTVMEPTPPAAPQPASGSFKTPAQQREEWGVAPTMALDSSALPLPGGLGTPGAPGAPGSAPGVPNPAMGTPPPGSSPGMQSYGTPAPMSAPHMQAAPPAQQKKGMSPVVMMAIGAGAVFLVGAFLMAIVVAIFLLR